LGISILEQVLRRLRNAEFQADAAYPGQKFPQITKTVAAVHIEKVDRDSQLVTLEVNVVGPGAMGGTACEVAALQVTEALRWMGAVCVQNGCKYDGVAQVYVVPVLATFTAVTEPDSCTVGPGFRIFLNEEELLFVTAFREQQKLDVGVEYVMYHVEPVGVSEGKRLWEIRLEERIPAGSEEVTEGTAAFQLKLVMADRTEVYNSCRWTNTSREFTREGLRRIREGFAMEKVVQ
jgi:hypothetical protein